MKNFNYVLRNITILLVVAVTLNSCSESNEGVLIDNAANDAVELARSAEVDAASSSVTDIVTEIFEFDEANPNSRV